MASVNKVILVGNLGADPEARYLPNGDAISNFRIATTESWKDKQTGEKKEATEWHTIVAFRKLAEICNQYLRKGSSVYIEGKLKTEEYEKDGVKRYSTKIVADSMQMLGSRQSGASDSAAQQATGTPAPRQQGGGYQDVEDDIPF